MKIKYGRKWMLGLLPRGYFTVASIVEVEETKRVSATPEESEPKSESSFAAASTYLGQMSASNHPFQNVQQVRRVR
jgi:hypothetical protein